MKTTKLYQVNIPYATNGVTIYEAEFSETAKQFKSLGEHPYIILKNRFGEPQSGYARSPEDAVKSFRLSLERQLNRLRGDMADVQMRLNILNERYPK